MGSPRPRVGGHTDSAAAPHEDRALLAELAESFPHRAVELVERGVLTSEEALAILQGLRARLRASS